MKRIKWEMKRSLMKKMKKNKMKELNKSSICRSSQRKNRRF